MSLQDPPTEKPLGRKQLESWLNKSLKIQMTDGRTLIGIRIFILFGILYHMLVLFFQCFIFNIVIHCSLKSHISSSTVQYVIL